jgi:hypothetical protein
VFGPDWLFINNLPDHVLEDLKEKIRQRLLSAQSNLYRNSLNYMLSCLDIPWNKQLDETKRQLEIINQRRNLDFTDTLSYLN